MATRLDGSLTVAARTDASQLTATGAFPSVHELSVSPSPLSMPLNRQSPLRLVAVAADVRRARSLAVSVASAFDAAEPVLVATVAEALAVLRREPFDALVALHEPPMVDALVLSRALRGAGDETPVAILGAARAIDLEAAAWDAGADEYACLAETTAAQLAGRMRRAIEARERLREMRRALLVEQQQLARDKEQTQRLVDSQQRLVAELQLLPDQPQTPAAMTLRLNRDAGAAYAALARRAVVSGSPRGEELVRLADDLADEGIAGPQLLELHLTAVQEVTSGMAPRAAQAVRDEADRLLFEAVVHLAEAYRRRYLRALPAQVTPAVKAA
jgi:DNA-binding response OmpR family regulator